MRPINYLFNLNSDRQQVAFTPAATAESTEPNPLDIADDVRDKRVVAPYLFRAASSLLARAGQSLTEGAAPVVSGIIEGTKTSLQEGLSHASAANKLGVPRHRILAKLGKSALLSPSGSARYLLLPVDESGTPIRAERDNMPSPFSETGGLTYIEGIGLGFKLLSDKLGRTAEKLANRTKLKPPRSLSSR